MLSLLIVILHLTFTSSSDGEEKEVERDPEADEGGREGKTEGAQTGFLFLGDGEGRTGQSSSGVATKVILLFLMHLLNVYVDYIPEDSGSFHTNL